MPRKLFCQRGKLCYRISLVKEWLIRDISDIVRSFSGLKFARRKSDSIMPEIVKGHFSLIMRRLEGVDMQLQHNKAVNLAIAADKLDGLVIHRGETFSFWKLIGRPTSEKGYLSGLTISGNELGKAVGGGLCQLANMIHWLVLNSPLTVTELHHHSDALFPDERRRVPFGTGTSVFYKNVDYRFTNNTDRDVQLRVWIKDDVLYGELRAENKFSQHYRITEENHRYVCENGVYYRCSSIWRETLDENGGCMKKELLLDNHSHVMYDSSLIPKDEIRES